MVPNTEIEGRLDAMSHMLATLYLEITEITDTPWRRFWRWVKSLFEKGSS